jgi:hypothetical protein
MSGGEESDVLTGKLWWASSDFHRVRRETGKGERSGYLTLGGGRRIINLKNTTPLMSSTLVKLRLCPGCMLLKMEQASRIPASLCLS